MNNPNSLKQQLKLKNLNQQKSKKNKNQVGPGPAKIAVVNQQRQVKIGRPQMTPSVRGDGSIRVRHREYLGDIAGSVLYSCISYGVNPGLPGTFPWLATIASQFESYSMQSLRFEFETMKSTATNGSLLMVIDYDASDGVPSSKQIFMNFNHSVRSPVWSECVFDSDFKEMHKVGPSRYNRAGALAANLDIKTYDLGNFLLAVQGCADTSTLGELYVSYDVILQSPIMNVANPGAVAFYSLSIVSAGAVTLVNPFGATPTVVGALSSTVTANTVTFNISGQYLFTGHAIGTVIASVPTLTVNGLTAVQSAVVNHTDFDAGGLFMSGYSLLITTAAGGSITFNFTGHATTITSFNVYITPVNGAICS